MDLDVGQLVLEEELRKVAAEVYRVIDFVGCHCVADVSGVLHPFIARLGHVLHLVLANRAIPTIQVAENGVPRGRIVGSGDERGRATGGRLEAPTHDVAGVDHEVVRRRAISRLPKASRSDLGAEGASRCVRSRRIGPRREVRATEGSTRSAAVPAIIRRHLNVDRYTDLK